MGSKMFCSPLTFLLCHAHNIYLPFFLSLSSPNKQLALMGVLLFEISPN
jgi:hypothetical protein